MNDYTPTAQQVRDAVLMSGHPFDQIGEIDDEYYGYETYNIFVEPGAAFDRWLAAHDAEVALKARREALEDAAQVIDGWHLGNRPSRFRYDVLEHITAAIRGLTAPHPTEPKA